MIPYVISIARPCYNRPELEQSFGSITEEELENFLLTSVSKFILDTLPLEDINYVKDITYIWRDYYSEYYMGNEPYSIMIFKDNEWQNATPSDEEIFNYIKNNEEKLSNNDDNLIENLDVLSEMNEYFESLLKNLNIEHLNTYNTLSDSEKIIFILQNSADNILNGNLKDKIDLFVRFTNLCIKEIQENIDDLREEAEKTNDLDELNKEIYLCNTLTEYRDKLLGFK